MLKVLINYPRISLFFPLRFAYFNNYSLCIEGEPVPRNWRSQLDPDERVSQWGIRWECALSHSPWGHSGMARWALGSLQAQQVGLCEGMSCLGSVPASWVSLPGLVSSLGVQRENLLSCGPAAPCQACCWACSNGRVPHIPTKTPLQMGCRSCNLSSELGCCSEAAQFSCSRSLTRWDPSWDRRGWGGTSLPASLWPSLEICGMELGAVWTWGRSVLLDGYRNLILFASSLWGLDTRFCNANKSCI